MLSCSRTFGATSAPKAETLEYWFQVLLPIDLEDIVNLLPDVFTYTGATTLAQFKIVGQKIILAKSKSQVFTFQILPIQT